MVVASNIKMLTIVLLSKDKTWKIGDFGLSTDGQQNGWTAAEDPEGFGTSGYRAPELMSSRAEGTFSNKSDIWAFGCIVYEVITGGERMFSNDLSVLVSTRSDVAARMTDALNLWMDCMPGIIQHRGWVLNTLVNTMRVDPEMRPTATELKGVLHEVLKAGRLPRPNERASRRVVLRRERNSDVTS